MDKDIIKQIEAILFSCGRKIEAEEISKLVGINSLGSIKTALKKIKTEYKDRKSPMMVVEEGTGWKMTVCEKYLGTVRKITPYMEFSKTLMETLAVVAWKQPIIQSDVIRIRTNKAYEHIAELEKMGFLAKEKHGRSFLLKLSQKFYDYFDLRNDVDVRNLFKHIKDTDEDEQKKVNEYSKKESDEKSDELKIEDEITHAIENGTQKEMEIEEELDKSNVADINGGNEESKEFEKNHDNLNDKNNEENIEKRIKLENKDFKGPEEMEGPEGFEDTKKKEIKEKED